MPTGTVLISRAPLDKAQSYTQAHWTKAPRFQPICHEYRFKASFTEIVRQSIQQMVKSYWKTNKAVMQQKIARHAMSLANLESGSTTLESGQSRPARTNACNRIARNVMNVDSSSSSESLIACDNNRKFTAPQPLEFAERLVAVSYHASTNLTSATAMIR